MKVHLAETRLFSEGKIGDDVASLMSSESESCAGQKNGSTLPSRRIVLMLCWLRLLRHERNTRGCKYQKTEE